MRGGKITFEILNNIKIEIENFKKLFREIEFSWEQIAPAQDKYLYKYTTLFYYLPALPNYREIDKKSYYKPGLNEEERRRVERYDFVQPNTKYEFLKHLQKFLESKEAIKLRDFVKQYLTPDNLKEFESPENLSESLRLKMSLAECLNKFQNVDFEFEFSDIEDFTKPKKNYVTIPILTYICSNYTKRSFFNDVFYEVTDETGYRQIDFFENFQKFITEYNNAVDRKEEEKIKDKTHFLQSTSISSDDFLPLPDLLSEYTTNAAERLWALFLKEHKHPTQEQIDTEQEMIKKKEEERIKEKERDERAEKRQEERELSRFNQVFGNLANLANF